MLRFKPKNSTTTHTIVYPLANGDFRLTGGDQGEFQLYQDGWNSVCEFHYYYIYYYHTEREFWATPESNVACRTLGFRRVDTYSFPYVYLFSSNSIYTDFRCYGSETDLSQCYNESKSYCYDGVNIKCISGIQLMVFGYLDQLRGEIIERHFSLT